MSRLRFDDDPVGPWLQGRVQRLPELSERVGGLDQRRQVDQVVADQAARDVEVLLVAETTPIT